MKNYLIIGASSGIGMALAEKLSNEGANVFGTYNSSDPPRNSENQKFFHLDVLEQDYDLSLLPETIDGVAYCPGSINLRPFSRIKPEDFVEDYKLQVLGAIRILQSLETKLKRSESASVVLFSTVAVQQGFSFHSQVSSSKGALEGLTRSLAAEWAPGIRVNAIAPSLTKTPLANRLLGSEEKIKANSERHPLKRVGEPEEIADMALFLLSDRSGWITGQVYSVDGGSSRLR